MCFLYNKKISFFCYIKLTQKNLKKAIKIKIEFGKNLMVFQFVFKRVKKILKTI